MKGFVVTAGVFVLVYYTGMKGVDGVVNGSCSGDTCGDADLTCDLKAGSGSTGMCKTIVDANCGAKGDCITNAACQTAGSTPCKCTANYVAKSDNKVCLARVGQTCAKDEDCAPGSTCNSGKKCECEQNKVAVNDKAFCRKKNGQTCSDSNECDVNAECKTELPRKCGCKDGFTADDEGRCGKGVDEACHSDNDCVSFATCKTDTSGQKCKCLGGYDASDKKCQKKSVAPGLAASLVLLFMTVLTSRLL